MHITKRCRLGSQHHNDDLELIVDRILRYISEEILLPYFTITLFLIFDSLLNILTALNITVPYRIWNLQTGDLIQTLKGHSVC